MLEDIKIDVMDIPRDQRSVNNSQLICESIMKYVQFATDPAGRLYYYEGGVYKPRGEEAAARMYIKLLKAYDRASDWRPRRSEGLIEYIRMVAPPLLEKPDLYRINLMNGIYDLEREELQPSSSEYRTTIQIPIAYDRNAECPEWDQFLQDVFPQGVRLMLELIGICLVPFTGLQKCIVLVGSGSNGKSTFLNGLQAAVGLENISNVSLHSLTNPMEKFSRANIVGKLINVFGDLSSKKIEDAANFKPLTGEDRLTIEYKHKAPFSYTPFCKLLFSCNEIIKSDDNSEGYKRRFIHIPFMKKFAVNPKKGKELEYALSDPKELSGLLNKVLPLINKVIEDGFTITPQIAEIIDNYHPIPDVTRKWLMDTLEYVEGAVLPSSRFYDYYCTHCQHSTEPFERGKLITYIKNLFPDAKAGVNKTINKQQVKCFIGLQMKDFNLQRDIENTVYDDKFIGGAKYGDEI